MATPSVSASALPARHPAAASPFDASAALMFVAFVAVPASFVPLAFARGGDLVVIPYQHFYIVSGVSLLAALVACILAVTTIQIGLYRVLFLCLGYMSMGAIFAVHGLTTPGILVPSNSFGAVAASAYLSLAAPAVFFALSYLPGVGRLERRLPFWPAGWLVVFVAAGLVAYAAIAMNTWILAELPLSRPPYSTALAIASIALFFLAAYRQAQTYRRTRLESQAMLIVAFVFLAEAAAAMVLFRVWSWGWWYYHLLMLASVSLAFRTLLIERGRGRSFRSVIEAALQLEVCVETEEIDVEVVAALVAAVEVKDRETQGHNHRVARLCVQIGHELGMASGELRALARAGLLHDVGKLGIPDAILHKKGPLTPNEWTVMKTHPEIGLKIIKRSGHFHRELLAVLYHHERMDGGGYPHGLAGDAIPIEARIVAVADMYDVLTSDRPYRKARTAAEAIETLRAEAGTHLDSRLVAALLSYLVEKTHRAR